MDLVLTTNLLPQSLSVAGDLEVQRHTPYPVQRLGTDRLSTPPSALGPSLKNQAGPPLSFHDDESSGRQYAEDT
jgi:hypothetical protein